MPVALSIVVETVAFDEVTAIRTRRIAR